MELPQPPPPPPGPGRRGVWTWVDDNIRVVAIVVAALIIGFVILGAINSNEDEPPPPVTEEPIGVTDLGPDVPDIDYEVTNCDVDRQVGFATATVELTANEAVDFVSFSGDLVREDGTVIGQGIGSVSNVTAGRSYVVEVFYSIEGQAGSGTLTCEVNLDPSF